MSFFDKLKDFSATLRRLAAHWRVLGALALLIGFGALYLQKRLSPASLPPEATAGKTTPAEKAPPADSLGDNKTGPPTRPSRRLAPRRRWKASPARLSTFPRVRFSC